MKIAIYPGTFDPITNGHMDIIERASELFDEVIVALARNSQKTPLFSEPERLRLIEQSLVECCPQRTNIRADAFQGLLVEYAMAKGATAVVRGLRALSDFEYEFQMALMNRKLAPNLYHDISHAARGIYLSQLHDHPGTCALRQRRDELRPAARFRMHYEKNLK